MPAKKLKALSSLFVSTVKKDSISAQEVATAELLPLKNLFTEPNSIPSSSTASEISKKGFKKSRKVLLQSLSPVKTAAAGVSLEAEAGSSSSGKGSQVSDGSGSSASHILKEISSILCRNHATESASLSSSKLSNTGELFDTGSNNILEIPWFSCLPPTSTSQRRKELSRERKQKWIYKNTQNRRFERLVKLCAQKLGADATLNVFGKLGRETGVKEYNALIQVCIEKARESTNEKESLEQIHKAFQLFTSMKENGFPLEEESYGIFLMYLIDMGLDQEFQFFRELIQNENMGSLSRLDYYEMLLWLHLKQEDRIRELCSSMEGNIGGSDFRLAECYLLAFCEKDREKEILKFLEMIDVTKISSSKNLTTIFKSLGRLSLENHAQKLILAVKNSSAGDNISSFIFEYAANVPNLQVEDTVSKFKILHGELEVLPSSTACESLITHCCKSLKVHAALEIVDWMCQSGLALSNDTFDPILRASEEAYDLDLVRPIYAAMRDHNLILKGETFKNLINLHVKMRDFEGAYTILKDLEELDMIPTPNMYNAIMAGYFREKNTNGGIMVLKQMQRAKVKPDSETFSHLIHNCDCEEDISKYMEEIERGGVLVTKHIYMALINAYANIGKFDKARQVVLDPQIPIKSMNEIKSVLVQALAYNGETLDALATYEEMKQAGCQPEPKAIISLIEYVRSEGYLDKLLELLGSLMDSPYWSDGCSRTVHYCIRHKHLSCAVDLLKQLKEKDESITCSVFDKIYGEILDEEPVDLDIAMDLLRVIKDELELQPSRTSLDFLLSACASVKDPHRAWQIWEEYGKAGLPMNVLTYLRMYQVMLATGELRSAREMLRKIPREDPHVRTIIKACQTTFCKPTMNERRANELSH